MYPLPEQFKSISPNLRRENLLYVRLSNLYEKMMKLYRVNYDLRNKKVYKPFDTTVLNLMDEQFENLKSITCYDFNSRDVTDRPYQWRMLEVDPLYTTSIYLINELGYTELTLLALEDPLIFQTCYKWIPYIQMHKSSEYLDLNRSYLIPLKYLDKVSIDKCTLWKKTLLKDTVIKTLRVYSVTYKHL